VLARGGEPSAPVSSAVLGRINRAQRGSSHTTHSTAMAGIAGELAPVVAADRVRYPRHPSTTSLRPSPVRTSPREPLLPVVLTIAGSDSGGGAGIQADLKTFHTLGTFGTSAITCLTAQSPNEVAGVEAVSPDMVALQIRTVCRAFPVAAAKTGMLYSAEIILSVASAVRECALPVLVVDPVMVATSGARLLREDAIEALFEELLPLATVVTPNRQEAEILAGVRIETAEDLARAARRVEERFGAACLAKGGHLADGLTQGASADESVDVLCRNGETTELRALRLETGETHGTGCTLSAALTAFLARGEELSSAARRAKAFVFDALQHPFRAGEHTPLGIR